MGETWIFLVLLSLGTIGVGVLVALRSRQKTEQRRHDDNAPKSSLAKDGPGPNPATAPRRGHMPADRNA